LFQNLYTSHFLEKIFPVFNVYQSLVFSAFPPLPGYFIQIYPVSEGYLRKIPVERRGKYPERREAARDKSMKTGKIFSKK
jgi:hypothetical protein